MKTFHKVLFVLAILIANCISAFAIEFTVDGVRYSVNKDSTTVRVAGYPSGSKPTGHLTIPESVTYGGISYPVTSIGGGAFYECSGLTSVTIPNSVTSISGWAFYDCRGLTSVTIGNSVTSIGDYAFEGCSGLTSVTIPNSVTSIGDQAFYCCSGLTSIKVEIGNSVYDSRENCNAIIETATNTLISGCKKTIIPNSVTRIGDWAFSSCSGLTSITIPNSVTSIGDAAFDACSGLTSIKVESGNSVYDSRENCNAIIETATNTLISGCKNTIIPNSVTSIGIGAFWGCSSLTSVTIPNSVTSIGDYAFYKCSGLTSVTIGNSVTSIGDYAFYKCSGLTRIDAYPNPEKVSTWANSFYGVPKDGTLHVLPKYLSAYQTASQWCDFTNIKGDLTEIGDIEFTVDGVRYSVNDDNTTVTVVGYPSGSKPTGDLTIPESVTYGGISYLVTEIGNNAFRYCSGLTSVTIPNSVTSIGRGAFDGCSGLTSVTIPNSVTSIGNWAFDDTAWYNNQPDGLVYAGLVAYKYKGTMPSGTSIVLKEGTKGIADGVFAWCSGLTSVTIPNSVTSIGYGAFEYCSGLTSVTIPNSVTSIGDYAFRECSGLTSVTIPNSVTTIGENAFYKCSGLTSVTIPNSVTSIGNWAFYECSGLTSITIPNSVTSIGKSAFEGCSGLTSVTIGNSVTAIGDYAFYDCSGLTSITIPNSVASIGDIAFSGCTGLTSIKVESGNSVYDSRENCNAIIETATNTLISGCKNTIIPNSVTSIGGKAFCDCSGLTSITIPNSVTEIGDSAFNRCSGLTSVTIPNSVTYIGNEAFRGCTGLTSLTIPNSVTSIGDMAFYECSGLTRIDAYPNPEKVSTGADVFYGVPKNGTLHVLPKYLSAYQTASPWKDFTNIKGDLTEIGDIEFTIDGVRYSVNDDNTTVTVAGYPSGSKPTGNLTIPESVTYGGISYLVTSISDNAFSGCSGLTSVTIPNSVTSIGYQAFSGCSGLTSVYSLNPVPPVINENTFSSYDADLFVPQGSLSAYNSAKGWSEFLNIKEIQETVKAESILLNEHSANLMIGDTLSLTAKVLPENVSTKTVAWSSNNPDVASVNDEGLVTALTTGTAIISATTTDGTVLSDSATIVVSTPTSAPSLSAGNYVCVNGDIVTVALSLANKQEIGGFQTDFTVPEGFTVALNSKGKYDITLNADRCVDHVVTTNKLSDGSIRVLAYSPSAEPFIGESGEICYIKLVADEDVKEGDHQLIFREILISESNGKGHRCDDLTSVLSTMPLILGDVNNDHKVNVQDVLLTANVSVGKDVDGFVFRAADVNKDGIINVSDVLLVANIAVGNSVTVSAAPRFGESYDILHVSDFMLNPGEERTVDVMLDNTVGLSALQMNLCLPAGVNLKKVALTGRATDGHAVVYNENTPGNINLMAFAASTESFTGNDGAILKLTLQADKNFCGDGAIELTDVKLAESDGYTREADDASARISAVMTGVESVYSDVCAYAEGQSIVVEATDAGKAQIVRPNGVMHEVKVNVGRNTYPMADGGIYFIRFAGKTFKVII